MVGKVRIFLILIFMNISFVYGNNEFDIFVNNLQVNSNLLSIQLKIINNSNCVLIVPGFVSQKYELINEELIITYFYDWPRLEFLDAFGLLEFSTSYIVNENEEIFYSVFLVNEKFNVLRINLLDEEVEKDFEPYPMMNDNITNKTFDKIIGNIKKVIINIGIIKSTNDRIINNIYRFSRNRDEFQMIRIEYDLENIIMIEYNSIELQ